MKKPYNKAYPDKLLLASWFTGQATRQAIMEAAFEPNSNGLDAACGIGQHTLWLAEKISLGGRVTGIDISPAHIEVATKLAAQSTHKDQVEFKRGDIMHLPFEDDSFDWAWCADTLWPKAFPDPIAGIKELSRVIKPGGTMTILYWSSHMFLPGYPLLEARLNAAFIETTTYMGEVQAHMHFLRALGWLKAVGLHDVTARSYVTYAQAPLEERNRKSIGFLIPMLWENLEPHVSEADWAEYTRLCTPESKDYILDCPDYFCFLNYSCFQGKVPVHE